MPEPNTVFCLVDCNNFYVSCERVFNPKLAKKPVVVLSNNDGVIVARSNEVKALKIAAGTPYFKVKSLLQPLNLEVLSSNYELYGDMSNRVMTTLSTFTPDLEIYSIDEAFMRIDNLLWNDLTKLGREIHQRVREWTGIPVSVGIGSTKTLAKAANEIAKKHPENQGVLNLLTFSPSQVDDILSALPVEDVWGIGRQYSKLLAANGINNAYQFKTAPESFVKKFMTVGGLRTQLELKGVSCFPIDYTCDPRKGIINSRSFSSPITDYNSLKQAVSLYTSGACAALRAQKSHALRIDVFITTNHHNTNDKQYVGIGHQTLLEPSDYTPHFIKAAVEVLQKIYRPGYRYKKAGVMFKQVLNGETLQKSLFGNAGVGGFGALSADVSREKNEKISGILDQVNSSFGKNSLFFASCGVERAWKMKRELKSPCYTTRWGELLEAR